MSENSSNSSVFKVVSKVFFVLSVLAGIEIFFQGIFGFSSTNIIGTGVMRYIEIVMKIARPLAVGPIAVAGGITALLYMRASRILLLIAVIMKSVAISYTAFWLSSSFGLQYTLTHIFEVIIEYLLPAEVYNCLYLFIFLGAYICAKKSAER